MNTSADGVVPVGKNPQAVKEPFLPELPAFAPEGEPAESGIVVHIAFGAAHEMNVVKPYRAAGLQIKNGKAAVLGYGEFLQPGQGTDHIFSGAVVHIRPDGVVEGAPVFRDGHIVKAHIRPIRHPQVQQRHFRHAAGNVVGHMVVVFHLQPVQMVFVAVLQKIQEVIQGIQRPIGNAAVGKPAQSLGVLRREVLLLVNTAGKIAVPESGQCGQIRINQNVAVQQDHFRQAPLTQIDLHQKQPPEEDQGIGVVGRQVHIHPLKGCQPGTFQGFGVHKPHPLGKQAFPVGAAKKHRFLIIFGRLAQAVQKVSMGRRLRAFVVNQNGKQDITSSQFPPL